jgi:ABC-type nitrate/sulfonate/bicarbonate transport system substrate-binding protein
MIVDTPVATGGGMSALQPSLFQRVAAGLYDHFTAGIERLRRLGGPAVAWAALNSKQVDGAVLAPPFTFAAEKAGYHAIVDIYDQPYQNVGIVMPRSRIDALKPALLAILPALREAMQTYNEQPDVAIKVLSENTKGTDSEVLEKTYEFYKTQAPWEPSLEPTLQGIHGMMDFLAPGVPGVKNTTPEQYVDRRILDVLSGSGA